MKKLRVILVGCGAISNAWFGAVKQRNDVELVGLVDLNREAADKRAAEHGLPGVQTGADLKAVIEKTRPDAVFDCTLPAAHVSVTTVALRHGCHVLGEKPLADTMPNARTMVAAAKKAGRIYAVMQNRRYMANIQALRRFLDSGEIGRITTVHCDFFIGAHFGGFRDHMKHVLLLDMAIHTFDQARYFMQEDAVTALAHEWNPPGSWYDHDASAVAVFEMTNKIVFCYRGSWCAEGLNTAWEAAWRIIGENGSVTWDGAHTFQAQVVTGRAGFVRERKDVEVPYDRTAGILEGHAGCIDEFIRCVQAGKIPQTVCTDNIKSLVMVHAAVESATGGRKVKCK
ncbi:MAG: Gfo/Idh/MocA family oxidoreductase [Verrucomicrobia bacterium]|nr:Gfo/Idh/MocA family oxidoreductase [Verrucomicrobiota bacterium]MCG2681717.1 Gfo/Idh/MocA family oxidoreductase [Kiritimatiellia bacterium]MBU4247178.1 Gfo/Idh/MocA family oxidoreductase [Verrucomicrobiota bacterium]MBU4291397.1 Gfo/Idh/MocA family oxidoreductase [Verrucomicrobiota bacterium]MBU4428565.1 Gfo/Idh/MocA family oxidoreductase [Verrucomicrobiota bacterium]